MNAQAANYAGKRALVVGLGDTGASCVRWLVEHDAEVRGTDSRAEPPHALHLAGAFPEVVQRLGGFDAADFDWADLVVVSPGVPLATPEIQAARVAGKDIVGDIELFARAIVGTRTKVIAITGSNGKSTVTSLAGHLCEAAGLDTVVAGNIGLPVLDALAERELMDRDPDVWVLELSSFQLETTTSLGADAATVLNISEDHMDRYAGLDDYAGAKAGIFRGCRVQVLNRDDPAVMAMASPGLESWTFGVSLPSPLGGGGGGEGATVDSATRVPSPPAPPPEGEGGHGHFGLLERDGRLWLAKGHERLFAVDELPIAGLHNAANALAALALCRAIGIKYEPMLAALKTFQGLPHRVEKVAEVDGRTFYDDSKGTNVGATAAALKGFSVPVVLIAGGDGKGQDFSPLKEAVGNARAVVQIGRDGPLVEAAIDGACAVRRAEGMAEAVRLAFELSRPGDAILLSPACASWDMFRNYAHRAAVFIAAVEALKAEREAADVS